METDTLKQAILAYEEQLLQVEIAISNVTSNTEKENLVSLKSDIQQLIELTRDNLLQLEPSCSTPDSSSKDDRLADEYALFMSEMEKEGVVSDSKEDSTTLNDELKSLEGNKCRAPHKHNWGDIVYHNAMICSVVTPIVESFEEIKIKVMFINPTHQEMLPCPYYLDTDCKFSEELCRYSHGEVVPFASLQEYVEPNFESLTIGSKVLARKPDKLWHRATIKQILKDKCLVKFDSKGKDVILDFHEVFPLEGDDDDEGNGNESSDDDESNRDINDIINMSLMITPSDQSLGEWEKYTKGVGSKLMEKMGYIIGTGLGKNGEGRIEPVTAVILPAGKSLDHCMKLRENAGGDKNLFSVERKLKKLQKQQEMQSRKAYEREKNKVNVFNFLNDTLSPSTNGIEDVSTSKHVHRQEIKKETSRNLNVASLKIDGDIKNVQRDLVMLNQSLTRHADKNSQMHKCLQLKLSMKQNELKTLQAKAVNIHTEQSIRSDQRKLTIF